MDRKDEGAIPPYIDFKSFNFMQSEINYNSCLLSKPLYVCELYKKPRNNLYCRFLILYTQLYCYLYTLFQLHIFIQLMFKAKEHK